MWQQHFASHVASALWVTGCLHISVSILRLFRYVAFDFVSESLYNENEPEKLSQNSQQQNLRNHHDGNSDYIVTFTTSEITSSYMFQRLKARVRGIQGMTAWCRVEVQFMSKTDAPQPFLSGCCTCRLVDVGEVEDVQLDIEGDSVLLSSVIIQKMDTGRCWKSSGNELWLHPGIPIRIPVCVTFDYISSFNSSQPVGVHYFRLFSSSRFLLLLINIATSSLGTFLHPMFFVLLLIDLTVHLPLVRHVLLFIASFCIWPLAQMVVLVVIVIFLSSAWMYIQFQDSMLDYGHR
jgi:sporulation protein YlmC with PRC-barrel domain